MASILKQLFTTTPQEKKASVGETVLSRNDKIVSILNGLKENTATIYLTFPDNDKSYQSKVLKIDEVNNIFALLKVTSIEGHENLVSSSSFQAKAEIFGATVTFDSCIRKFLYLDQNEYYEAAIPNSVNYIQRRSSYRVQISSTHLIPLIAELKQNQQKIHANVHDIAMQGIGIIAKATDSIKPGDELSCCQLQLDDQEIISFTLDVKHIIPLSPGTVRIGGSFKDLNHRSSQLIGRLVRDLERLQIGN